MIRQRRVSPSIATPQAQGGVVLFVALIVLVALTLASIALVRSVDTTNVIAGNLAFKQATLQAGDLGVEAAVKALNTIPDLDTDSTAAGYVYYATRRETDAQGLPTQSAYGAGALAAVPIKWDDILRATTAADKDNQVRVVIDRLCQGGAIVDIDSQCMSEPPLLGGSKKIGPTPFSASSTVFYRVTVQVTGPRKTVSMVQAILSL